MHLVENSSVVSYQIMHLSLQFADGAIHTVKFCVVSALNHAIILGLGPKSFAIA